MPQLVKKRRSGWAVLATGALVASLLAVGASSAVALDEDSKANAPAATSACVGDATGDMMFSDVSEMHYFRAAINCLAYYGVTIGYGDGTFRPNADVSNEEMILFMQRAAGIAGADAEAVVGDFAMSGSDPVHRGDMALLIARLLAASTTKTSPVNVTNNADGTFAVAVGGTAVEAKDWDYFADSRSSQNRVSDSAASALYELGVAKGTGMGNFSPASTVSRGAMAAFITRALAHTTARPEGVTIQSDGPGGVVVSVRDANFHPVANAVVDVFSADANRVDEAFKEDGSCDTARVDGEGGNAKECEIDILDAVTGLSGDYDPGTIDVDPKVGGTTVWAWTGETGDKVEDGGEGLAHINLTETATASGTSAKITTDPVFTDFASGSPSAGVERAAFGSTVTVTIQLVSGTVGQTANRPDGGPSEAGLSYTVTISSQATLNEAAETATTVAVAPTAGASPGTVSTQTVIVDASGKGTFTITAADPDPNDNDDAQHAGPVDRVDVTYSVVRVGTAPLVDPVISATVAGGTGADAGTAATHTIRFSDSPSLVRRASLTPAVKYLAAPRSGGSAGNVVTVKLTDQYGKPIGGKYVQLNSNHIATDTTAVSTFPYRRLTDSSGTVRIGYSYKLAAGTSATGSIESLVANTPTVTDDNNTPNDFSDDTVTLDAITGGAAMFYWTTQAVPDATGTVTAAVLQVADVERNTVVIGGTATAAPSVLVYDDNDQFVTVKPATGGGTVTTNVTMAAFEEALVAAFAADGAGGTARNDTVGAQNYDPTDASVIARFTLTVS